MPDINYAEKWGSGLVKGFNNQAVTADMFTQAGDFVGVYTYHDNEIGDVPLSSYDVTRNVTTQSRYGDPVDVGNIQYDYQVEQKISFSAILDEIYNQGVLNEHKVAAFMEKQKNHRISPALDKYRLKRWCEQAGFHVPLPSGGITKENVVEFLIDCHAKMEEAGVKGTIVLTVAIPWLKYLKLAPEWVETNDLAKKTLPRGTIAEFDGMAVKKSPAKNFPDGIPFLISVKESLISPMKVKKIDIFEKCENNAGSRVNFLMIYDAFVRGHVAQGVLTAAPSANICATPTITVSGGKATIASTTSGATVKYTIDGSDPRFSKNAKVYSAAADVPAGARIRAAAMKDGMYWSDMAEKDI